MIQDMIPAEKVQDATRDILSRPEFSSEEVDTAWVGDLFEPLIHWLQKLSKWAEATPEMADILVYVLTFVLFLLIAHILYVAFKEIALIGGPGKSSKKNAILVALEGEAENWEDALALCRKALDDNEFRRAIWILHRLFLSMLDHQGALTFSRWKTNGDYLKECSSTNTHHGTLVRLTAAYEEIVYGHREAPDYDLESLFHQVAASRSAR